MGAEPRVEWENDKPTVVALRETRGGLRHGRAFWKSASSPWRSLLDVEQAVSALPDDLLLGRPISIGD